ncbi:hypothetical protein AALO_G00020440 [Alosa alosa]|uniref:Uncharacterized protein n=1 Tax=Alosa alosa TaxID=278164 RepID=A0AAV6H9P4_9TELE|nr:hypothetical protein AALO_G00020440 [Alosa alosa]
MPSKGENAADFGWLEETAVKVLWLKAFCVTGVVLGVTGEAVKSRVTRDVNSLTSFLKLSTSDVTGVKDTWGTATAAVTGTRGTTAVAVTGTFALSLTPIQCSSSLTARIS